MTPTLTLAITALAAFTTAGACFSLADMCKKYENTRTFRRLSAVGRVALFASFFFAGAGFMVFVDGWF